MTNRDVMVQILHEVTGKPKELIGDVLHDFAAAHPGSQSGFDRSISDAEAEQLLNELRKEKSGILNWLLQGNAEYIKRLNAE